MSIQEKIKALKKKTIQVKGSILLDQKQANGLDTLLEIVGTKELLTIALSEPKQMAMALKKQKRVARNFNHKIEISNRENEIILQYLEDGYTMDEILSVAFTRLNIQKSLNELQGKEDE